MKCKMSANFYRYTGTEDDAGQRNALAGVVTCKDSMNEINIIPYHRIRWSQFVRSYGKTNEGIELN